MAAKGDNSKANLITGLNGLLADHVALYFKTKNFHWHVTGPDFRDLHLLFDEQATAIYGQIDVIAERVRKNGAATLTSLGTIAKASSIKDQDSSELKPRQMIAELRDDNVMLIDRLRALKDVADEAGDNATDSLIDDWTDMAELRVWFLSNLLA